MSYLPRTRSDPEGFAPSWSSPLTPKEIALKAEKRRFEETLRIYKALFLPCKKKFGNAVFKVRNGHDGCPEVIVKARKHFAENKNQILSEPVPQCGCGTAEERQAFAEASVKLLADGNLNNWVATVKAVMTLEDEASPVYWQRYLDMVREILGED